MSDATKLPGPSEAAFIPQLCHPHQVEVVKTLRIPPEGPWIGTLMAVNLACFRAVTYDARFKARTEGDPSTFTIVLAEIGCLACAQPRAFRTAVEFLAHEDWMTLFAVAYGRAKHERWPAEWTIKHDIDKQSEGQS